MSRLYGYAVYHNYQKKFRIKDPVRVCSTHGEMAGIPSFLIEGMREKMFQERAFLSRLHLKAIDQKVWMKAVYDPLAGSITYGYLPKFALA